MRVTGVQPAMPDAGSDPYEDGLEAEAVLEPAPVQSIGAPFVAAVEATRDPQLDLGLPMRSARSDELPGVTGAANMAAPLRAAMGGTGGGNAAHPTGFSPTPTAFAELTDSAASRFERAVRGALGPAAAR
jgi:hypothetical protein